MTKTELNNMMAKLNDIAERNKYAAQFDSDYPRDEDFEELELAKGIIDKILSLK